MLMCFRVGVFLLAGGFCTHLFSQSASVNGQVLDSGGAAVPGAALELLNTETKVTLKTVSDASGVFILSPVTPGTYQATVTAAGFATWVQSGMVLEVGQKGELSPVLKVGALAGETVSVTATAPELKAEDSDLSTVTESVLVANIPLDVRNPFQEVNFTPGVTQSNSLSAGTNATTQSTTNTFYINGAKGGEEEIIVDGAANTINYDTHAAGDIPGLDAVKEFRIYTSAYSPEFGHTAGGVESFTIKSGTNTMHGGAWEYNRSAAFDANGFNANAAGQPKPSFSRNQFGGQVGGPVVLPGYNGHNRTFFFGSYEQLNDSTPGAGFTTTVPTALERTGDFSQTFNSNGAPLVIYDPSTTQQVAAGGRYTCSNGTFTASSTGFYRCQMSYNGKVNVIDPARFNPIAQKLLAMYPLPNQKGVGASDQNNFFSAAPNTDNNYSEDIRIDHKLTDKHSMFGHLDIFDNYIIYGQVFGQGTPSYTPQNSNDHIPGRNIMVDHTWVISPTVVFDHHFSWAHMQSARASVNPVGTAMFGIPASVTPGYTATFTPQVTATSGQIGTIGNFEPLEANPNSVWQYAATVSWVKGIHTVKFGADLRVYRDQLWDPQLLTVNTSRTFTGGPIANSPSGTTGNAVAELLLGQATVTSGYAPLVKFGHGYAAFFVGDNARVTRKLTLNYGLRYSYETGDIAQGNQLSYIDQTSPSPIAAQVPSIPNIKGGVGIVGLNGTSRSLQIPEKLHWEPRFGFAYSLDKNTVMHGGFGIFWHAAATYQTNPSSFGFTRKSTSIDAAPDGVTPLYNLSNPFPSGLPNVYGNNPSPLPGNNTGSGPLSIELGQSVSGNPRSEQFPYQENWSLDLQHSLPGGFVVTAAYAGSAGVHLFGAVQLNELPASALGLGSALNTVVSNPFFNVITDGSSLLSKSTIQQGYLYRPYPQFQNFTLTNSPWGHSTYHAFQLTVEHRLSKGLSLLLGYTHSKSIDDIGESGTSSSIQDNGCRRCERSIAALDQPNVVRLSTLYQLPWGPQKQFLNHGLFSQIIGGWELGGTYQYNTGQPLSLTSPQQSASLSTAAAMRPTLTGAPVTTRVTNSAGQLSDFNPAAFKQTGTYAFGNAPRFMSALRNPSYTNLDALLQKQVKFGERMGFTIRLEAQNVLNAVVFGGADAGVSDTAFGYNPHTQKNNPRIAQLSGRFTF
jgi:hypothetical protein